MRVISRRSLHEFIERHPDAKEAVDTWYKFTERTTWKSGDDVARQYPYARPIEDNRAVFKIMGNSYRLVARIEYQWGKSTYGLSGPMQNTIRSTPGRFEGRAMRIQSEAEYESALKRIDELWGAKPDTVEGQELDTLFLAVETYEDEHYPMDEPTSYAAIEFHLDRLDLSIDELPVTQADKETLRTCIANRRAVPEALVIRISNILEIPRDVLGSSDLADADPAPLHTTRITR